MFCKKCWGDAYWRSLGSGRPQYECYYELLEERKDYHRPPEVRANTQSATQLPGKRATMENAKSPATGDMSRSKRGPVSDIIERRAKFVYDGARLAAQAAQAPIIPVPWEEREQEFRLQFRAVIERQCGDQRSRSPEELHGGWMQAYFGMGWVYGPEYSREKKTHPDLVPYSDLGQLERDKDAVFVALCEIARQWVYLAPGQASELAMMPHEVESTAANANRSVAHREGESCYSN